MKILVTGGSGYVGSVLVPSLIKSGDEVYVMDIQAPASGNWLDRDIFLEPVTENDVSSFDAVIHLAAIVGDIPSHEKPQRAVEVNFLATKYLARVCKKMGTKLIFASTCSVYGVKNEVCREDSTDPEPFSVYGITKLEAENDVLDAGGIVLRMATIYGISPRMRYDLVINEFIRGARTEGAISIFGGKQMRPFLEINSAVSAYEKCLKSNISGEILNLTDGNKTILEIGGIVQKEFGCKLNVFPEIVDRRSYSVDFRKAVRLLDFQPKPPREGIKEMKQLKV